MTSKKGKINTGMQTSPWIILGATVILLVVVVTLGIQNARREKRYMTQVLRTKGAALIRGVEAGARTGMMGMMWGGVQVQHLLEEAGHLPGVLYMAVIDPNGIVVAHSDPTKVGRPFRKNRRIVHVGPDFEENWQLVYQKNGRPVFEVHRHFRPVPRGWQMRNRHMGGMMQPPGTRNPDKDWLDSRNINQLLIVVGLDVTPFEETIVGEIRNTVLHSALLLLLGFAGFVSLFWMQSYRAARRSLQDTSAFADNVVAHLPVGLIATDREGRIAVFNAAAEKISGLQQTAVLGRDPERVLPAHLCGLKAKLDSGSNVTEKEMECAFANGHRAPVSVSATRIVNEEQQMVGHALILRDLGEVRQLQAEIARQEKLAALGGLAAGVAHEIRNPLSSIKGLATYFAGKFAADSEDRHVAQVMTQEVDRLNRVINELLEFARPTDLKHRPSDINQLLRHSLQLVQQDAAGRKIVIDDHLAEDLCPAHIDPDRLSQCLLNLYLNAIQAMRPGGRLTVCSAMQDSRSVRIEVSDNGCGMTPEQLEHIFDPYFTTKAKGTGLGLAIVHKIVEAHGGRIHVESEAGQGSTFVLLFPCQGQAPKGDHESG